MGGFAGMAGKADPKLVRGMLAAMAHREPVEEELYRDTYACLGQNLEPLDLQQDTAAAGAKGLQILWDGSLYPPTEEPEAVAALLQEGSATALRGLEGAFAFAVYDPATHGIRLGRDPLGIRPLYYGYGSDGTFFFASELKALLKGTSDVRVFPPGYVFDSAAGWQRYYAVGPAGERLADPQTAVSRLREALEQAVEARLQGGLAVGTFLSGGLDSSLISAIAKARLDDLPSFAVGVAGCPDLRAAQEMAEYLGTRHFHYEMTPEEIRAALPEVIHTLESFDPALVRGAIATHFAARLASGHVQAVFSGEGADELFGGYAYLKDFTSPQELEAELLFITEKLHQTGLQRVDRFTRHHGLEARLPFLDSKVIGLAFSIPPSLKIYGPGKVEKWVVREAARGYLPESILQRGKEKFAIGTGTADSLRDWAASQVTDADFQRERWLPGGFEIKSKEELFYYRIFREFFDAEAAIAAVGRSRSLDPHQRYA